MYEFSKKDKLIQSNIENLLNMLLADNRFYDTCFIGRSGLFFRSSFELSYELGILEKFVTKGDEKVFYKNALDGKIYKRFIPMKHMIYAFNGIDIKEELK